MHFKNRTQGPQKSFYWYDIETTGTSPKHDRITQFASQRTDEELHPIGEPYSQLVQVPDEVLLKPEAMLITKLGPEILKSQGIEEWRLLSEVSNHLAQPQTCLIGYNNMAFDNEFLRFSMYRNLRPPYDHEWKNGNSRMDLIGILQLTCALRPEGMQWPIIDGEPSYSLTDIAQANDLDTSNAHDALADVYMTLDVARLVKKAQPNLWAYACSLRSKETIDRYTTRLRDKPLIHVSMHYSKKRYCVAPVLPIVVRPNRNSKELIVVDLSSDLSQVLNSSAEELRTALFSRDDERDSAQPRPGIHTLALNRYPIIAPFATLRDENAKRLGIDKEVVSDACRRLTECSDLPFRLQEIYAQPPSFEKPQSAEEALYESLPNDPHDVKHCKALWHDLDGKLPWRDIELSDDRLKDLRGRLKAHYAPEEMNTDEESQYRSFVRSQLTSKHQNINEIRSKIKELRSSTKDSTEVKLLGELDLHTAELANTYVL